MRFASSVSYYFLIYTSHLSLLEGLLDLCFQVLTRILWDEQAQSTSPQYNTSRVRDNNARPASRNTSLDASDAAPTRYEMSSPPFVTVGQECQSGNRIATVLQAREPYNRTWHATASEENSRRVEYSDHSHAMEYRQISPHFIDLGRSYTPNSWRFANAERVASESTGEQVYQSRQTGSTNAGGSTRMKKPGQGPHYIYNPHGDDGDYMVLRRR